MNSKERWMWVRYYTRRIIGWIRKFSPLIYTIVFSFLFIILLKYHLSKPELPPCESQFFHVTGTVFMEIKDTKNTMDIIPVSGVTIEIGGFQTMTDANGNYELNFRSEIIQGIPVILHQKDREVIDRISFGCKKFVMHKDFTFR